MSVVIIICAGLLVCYALYSTIRKALGKQKGASCCGTKEVVSKSAVEDKDESHYPYKYIIDISGMSCSHCAKNVENAINNMGNVWARVNLGKAQAEVLSKKEYEKEDFIKALSETDYKVDNLKKI